MYTFLVILLKFAVLCRLDLCLYNIKDRNCLQFLVQELISYRYWSCSCCSSCWGDFCQKRPRLCRLKSYLDEVWQDWSSNNYAYRYASTDEVGFSIWRHTLKITAITSFYAKKCCHLVSGHKASDGAYAAVPPVPDLYTFVAYLFV